MNRPEFVKLVASFTVGMSVEEVSIFHNFIAEKGICPGTGELSMFDVADDGRWPTVVSKFFIKAGSTEERTFDTEFSDETAYRGYTWCIYGDAAIGYRSAFANVTNIMYVPEPWLNVMVEAAAEGAVRQARKAIEDRKNYGRSINDQLAALGLGPHQIQCYWGMRWRKDITPTEFYLQIRDASSYELGLALRCNATWQLDVLKDVPTARSFPRRMDIIQAVAKATNVKAASDETFNAWLKQVKTMQKHGIDIRPQEDGLWVF